MITVLVFTSPALGSYPSSVKNKIFSELIYEHPEQCFAAYRAHYRKTDLHDFELLRSIAELILDRGYRTGDDYVKKCCVLGAGISGSSAAFNILTQSIEDPDYILQLLTLNALTHFNGQTVENLLLKGMVSPYPMIRIEAAYKLALLKYPYVLDRLRPFLDKIPEEAKPFIGSILIHIKNEESNAYIKQLLCDPNPIVRSRMTLIAAENGRDCFLSSIRNLAGGAHPCEKETAAFALGKLQDFSSRPILNSNLKKNNPHIKLASILALELLRHESFMIDLLKEEILENNNLFAVNLFRNLSRESAEKILLPIFETTRNEELKFNCAAVLISHKIQDRNPYLYIGKLLLQNESNQPFFATVTSPGETLFYHKMLQHFHTQKLLYNGDTRGNEQLYLQLTADIIDAPCRPFDTEFILRLLNKEKEDFNPIILNVLGNRGDALDLEILEKASRLPGRPFTRTYANMILYKINRDPKRASLLKDWLFKATQDAVILQENDLVTDRKKQTYLKFTVTPEQQTRLLIEILETIVQAKREEDISLFLDILSRPENKNFYLLLGLLIKMTE